MAEDIQAPIDDSVNVVNPIGKVVSLPKEQIPIATSKWGYRPATDKEVFAAKNEDKYGTPSQMAKTALEQGASALTFGASIPFETKVLGVNPEDIEARAQVNPGTATTAQIGALTASSLLGVGEGAILGKVGRAAAEATGLGREGASFLSKIGSHMVQQGVETGMMGAGDEVARAYTEQNQDPDTFMQTAATNIGLSTLLGIGTGGAFGVVSPLWSATGGKAIKGLLEKVATKSGGIEGAEKVMENAANGFEQNTGIALTPEERTLTSDNLQTKDQVGKLYEESNSAGQKVRNTLNSLNQKIEDGEAGLFNTKVDDIDRNLSKSSNGKQIGESLKNEYDAKLAQATPGFEAFNNEANKINLKPDVVTEKYGPHGEVLPDDIAKGDVSQIQNKMQDYANQTKMSATPEGKNLIQNSIKEIGDAKTGAEALDIMKSIRQTAWKQGLYREAAQLDNIVRYHIHGMIEQSIGQQSPELLQSLLGAKQQYKALSDMADTIHEVMKVDYNNPSDFSKGLEDKIKRNPQDFTKLDQDARAYHMQMIKENFPETFDKIKDYSQKSLLSGHIKIGPDGRKMLDTSGVLREFNKYSPEYQQMMFDQNQIEGLKNSEILKRGIFERKNPSGTAGQLDSMMKSLPNASLGILAYLMGGGEDSGPTSKILGFMAAALGGPIANEARGAMRMALIKYLESGKEISPAGFKSMVEYFKSGLKGDSLISRGAKDVFDASKTVLPLKLIPDDKRLKNLDKKIDSFKENPEDLLDVGGTTTVYLPNHGAAIGSLASNTVNYLQSINPTKQKQAPLDEEPEVPKSEQSQYNRTLAIAEQPLMVLNHIKDGTLTTRDMKDISTMYPSLYPKLKSKLNEQLINSVNKKIEIPYKTKLSLSLFMGQPLDSTMTPHGIQSSQMALAQGQVQQAQKQIGIKKNLDKLGQFAQSDMTSQQSREARHLKS
jgi:hypothetical protein